MQDYGIKFSKLLYYSLNVALTIIEGFLAFRLVLKLLNANNSIFVDWIYDVSDGILSPFEGTFGTFTASTGNQLEFTTIFVIVFYGLVYYFIYQLIGLLTDVVTKNKKNKKQQSKLEETDDE